MEERRVDYPTIIEKLEDIKVEMARVATLVEERNFTAISWRDQVCKKFDKIFDWLEKLPCKERKSLSIQVKALWGFIGAIVIAVVVDYIKRK